MPNVTCDFVCIGGGLGGLAAAIRAHDLGLEVLVIEKSDFVGGVAAYSSGTVWVPNNHLAKAEGLSDSFEEAEAYLNFISASGVDYDRGLRAAFLESTPEAVEYYTEQADIRFSVTGRPDHYFPSAPGSKSAGRALEVGIAGTSLGEWRERTRTSPHFRIGLTHREIITNGGPLHAFDRLRSLVTEREAEDFRSLGPGLAAGFVKAALVDRSIPVRLSTRAIRLITNSQRVSGVVAAHSDGTNTVINARKGVLIATGSYGSASYAAQMEGLPEIVEGAPPVLDGDGLTLTDPVAAALVRSGRVVTGLGFMRDDLHPGTEVPVCQQVSFRATVYPHSIVVNSHGKRFGDESFYRNLDLGVKYYDDSSGTFPNYPCYLIMDDQFRERYPLTPTGNWPQTIQMGDSLSELATRLGINSEGLTSTAKQFNHFASSGKDPEFHRGDMPHSRLLGDSSRPHPNLGPIEQPPFWGVELKLMGTGVYTIGLKIDENGRVLTRLGEPVAGLYATGNAVAYTEIQGYTGGLANARNIAYSYRAASAAS